MPETATEVDGDKYDITKALSQVTYNMSGVSLKLGSKDNGGPKHDKCEDLSDLLSIPAVHRSRRSNSLTVISDAERSFKSKRRLSCQQPPNTIMYTVKANDSMASIAAFYDTTPSVLRKINRLTVDFLHTDQILYIPLLTQSEMLTSSSSSSNEDERSSLTSTIVPPSLKKPYPGLAHRVNSKTPPDSADSTPENPCLLTEHKELQSDEDTLREETDRESTTGADKIRYTSGGVGADKVDQCPPQMYIKVNSKYILPDDQGEIDGTLLVTPNAVMFDPYVCDPLVIENGVDEYGLIAKLDTLISLAIYRDSEAMHALHKNKKDPSICKPQIYHQHECNLRTEASQTENSNSEDSCGEGRDLDRLSAAENSQLSCSCGASDRAFEHSLSQSKEGITIHDENKILNTETITRDNNSDTVDWDDNTWINKDLSNRESSRVTFDLDTEAKSTPISCRPMTVNSASKLAQFSPDSADIDYDLGDEKVSQSLENRIKLCQSRNLSQVRNASCASSIYSVGVTSNTELYVDYGCGMFAHGSVSSNSETKDLHHPHPNPTHVTASADGPAHTLENPSVTKLKAEDDCDGANRSKLKLHLEGVVTKEDKPGLFSPITDLIAGTGSQEEHVNSFYLCLQVGRRIDNQHKSNTSCPIDSYQKSHKPEYWFTIPADKADSLYMFFIEWGPEIYGEEIADDDILNSRGFMAITEEDSFNTENNKTKLPCSPLVRQLSRSRVFKDWEIVSIDEILRQKSLLDIDKYLPLPELQGNSVLLSEEHIKQIATSMPPRVEGHRWRLAYSHAEHGFSLNTLYRNMCEFDSATLVVVQDNNDNLFGAFSSSPIHLSDHFYGTGECFLYSFDSGYKTYPWSGRNMFCVRGGLQGITFGTGSATCGLWLDSNLYRGRTQHCDTYDNEPLTGKNEDFLIRGVEIWSLNDEEYD